MEIYRGILSGNCPLPWGYILKCMGACDQIHMTGIKFSYRHIYINSLFKVFKLIKIYSFLGYVNVGTHNEWNSIVIIEIFKILDLLVK